MVVKRKREERLLGLMWAEVADLFVPDRQCSRLESYHGHGGTGPFEAIVCLSLERHVFLVAQLHSM